MSFINVGAYVDGVRPKSKKALKEALADSAQRVVFDQTALYHVGPVNYRPNSLPDGVTLSVVGPDPYTKRNWYANVTRGRGGQVYVDGRAVTVIKST